jgi:hypothetical protein
VNDRLAGVLLFLPVPLVLWLLTRAPLGVVPSVVLGIVLTLTHRLYARPFARGRADRRCLWCGGAIAAEGGPVSFELEEPLGRTAWTACGPLHADRLARFLGSTERHPRLLRAGILGTLVVFLVALMLAGFHLLGHVLPSDAVAFFRLGIAVSVLPLGWWGPRAAARPLQGMRVPFPVHIQALIGTRAVVWLFRIVGLVWLAQAIVHIGQRLAVGGS